MRSFIVASMIAASVLVAFQAKAEEPTYHGVRVGGTFHPPTVPGTRVSSERDLMNRQVRVNPKPVYVRYDRELDRAVRGTPSVEKYLGYGFTIGDYRGGYPVRYVEAPPHYYDVPPGSRWNP